MSPFSAALLEAVRDYLWLLDRGYPTTASIKLVGDRHRLDKEERLVLFRGVASRDDSLRRRSIVSSTARGRVLLLDGYNQLFSVMHYREGKRVFLSTDGLLRDVGAAHGRIPDEARFDLAMDTLADLLAAIAPARVEAWFDAPVSGSALHARSFAEKLRSRGLDADALVGKSADAPLKAAPDGAAVATGDSAVVDALAVSGRDVAVFDAARSAIESAYGHRSWQDLGAGLSVDEASFRP